jgi:hypothetical protein
MMPLMAKKKPSQEPASEGRTSSRRGLPLHVWLDPAIIRALEAYVSSISPRTTKTAVVEAAILDVLTQHKFWPPPVAPEADP